MEVLTIQAVCKACVRESPPPKIDLLYKVQYLHFRYLKFLVIFMMSLTPPILAFIRLEEPGMYCDLWGTIHEAAFPPIFWGEHTVWGIALWNSRSVKHHARFEFTPENARKHGRKFEKITFQDDQTKMNNTSTPPNLDFSPFLYQKSGPLPQAATKSPTERQGWDDGL